MSDERKKTRRSPVREHLRPLGIRTGKGEAANRVRHGICATENTNVVYWARLKSDFGRLSW